MSEVLNEGDGTIQGRIDEHELAAKNGKTVDTENHDELVHVQISLDVTKALRKLANANSMKIGKALYAKSPQTFSELQKMTGLESNILSRAIYEMRANSLLTQKGKEYYLTKYSVVLLDAVNGIRSDLRKLSDSGSNLFSAHNVTEDRA